MYLPRDMVKLYCLQNSLLAVLTLQNILLVSYFQMNNCFPLKKDKNQSC